MQYNSASGGGNSPYNNVAQVIREIRYLNPKGPGTGVAIFRDSQAPGLRLLSEVAGGTGAKADLYYSYRADGSNDVREFRETVDALLARNQLASIEGGLEVDNPGWGLAVHRGTYTAVDGEKTTGWPAVIALQKDLYSLYRRKVPVMLWSLAVPGDGQASSPAVRAAAAAGTTVSALADEGNFHFYPHQGRNPQEELQGFLHQETGYTPGKPFSTTETGFNDGNNSGGSYAGNPGANAVYTLENILDLFRAGSTQIDLYELNNDMVSGGFEDFWGLFENDGRPKLAARYLRNFLAIVSDGAAHAPLHAPEITHAAPVGWVRGLTNPADMLLIEKHDGTLDLVVWSDERLCDSGGHLIRPKTQAIQIAFQKQVRRIDVFDPSHGSDAVLTLKDSAHLAVTLHGSPLILQLSR